MVPRIAPLLRNRADAPSPLGDEGSPYIHIIYIIIYNNKKYIYIYIYIIQICMYVCVYIYI